MASLAVKPSRRARAASRASPAVSRKSACTPSMAWTPAAAAAIRQSERASWKTGVSEPSVSRLAQWRRAPRTRSSIPQVSAGEALGTGGPGAYSPSVSSARGVSVAITMMRVDPTLTPTELPARAAAADLRNFARRRHLRQHDAVGPPAQHRRRGRRRSWPLTGLLTRTQRCGAAGPAGARETQHLPRAAGSCAGGHGILEIEDQRIGLAAERLGLLALAVPRHEQQRPERRLVSLRRASSSSAPRAGRRPPPRCAG